MNTTNCPYCHSHDIVKVVEHGQPSNSQTAFAASASFATIGASVTKYLPIPVSPLIGGVAGAVLGGLFGEAVSPEPKSIGIAYLHCQNCNKQFRL